jgi:hypothetical protein
VLPNINRSVHAAAIGKRTRLALFATLLGTLTLCATAQPVFPAPDPGKVILADSPVRVPALGLKITPPTGSSSLTQSLGGQVAATIILPDNIGSVGVHRRALVRDDLTLIELESALLKRALGLPDVATGITIETEVSTGEGESLGRSPFIAAGGLVFRPFYIRMREGDNPFQGFAILLTARTEFLLFQLFTTEPHFDRAREMFEVMLATVELDDAASTDRQRGEAIEAGVTLLAGLSPEEYDAIIGDFPEQFERIYKPAPGGAEGDETEVGYRRIKAWIGPREELTGETPRPNSPDGYLLRIDGLVLLDEERRADSRSLYFLSRDRAQEAWSVEMAIRGPGGKPEVWSEIGARSGTNMSVQISRGGGVSHTIRPQIEGPGYISRLESYLLPQLLIKAGETGRYAFYSYDQAAEANRLRFVELTDTPERPGLWRVITRRTDDQGETAEFNQFARLIRVETTEGVLKRPIEFERLYSLWESKGLPLD